MSQEEINRETEFEAQNIAVEPVEQTVVLPGEEIVLEPGEEVVLEEVEIQPEMSPTVVEVDRDVHSGMFGMPEIIGLALSGLVLLGMLGFYFLVLVPAQSDLKNRKAQRDEQEIKLTSLKSRFGDSSRTEEIVATLERSVNDFEGRYLPIASIGRTGLYDRINGLMYAYHLRNTSGPDYTPLEITEVRANQPQKEERGQTKFKSLFPGVYISMTVEGSYVNLRRFISEIEASSQFVVVSTVQLEAAENTEQNAATAANPPQQNGAGRIGAGSGQYPAGVVQQPARVASPKGKTMGEVVSLHLELAAYFRREMVPGSALKPLDAPVSVK